MKYLILALMALIIVACNTSPTNEMQKHNSVASTDSLIDNAGSQTPDTAFATGARLVAANDCLGCHKLNVQGIGPSYKMVANKYPLTEGNIENLAHKIISGGIGEWGTKQAMTPHSNVTTTEAESMVKYILSLRDTL